MRRPAELAADRGGKTMSTSAPCEIGVGQVAGANELPAQALDQRRQQSIAGQPARRHRARVGGAPIGRAVVVSHDPPALSSPV